MPKRNTRPSERWPAPSPRVKELIRKGAQLAISAPPEWLDEVDDATFLELVLRALDAGLGDRLLLSHDRGWYDPAQPGGGAPKPYTPLTERFLPLLADAGVDDATIRHLTYDNPFTAFARP